MRIRTYKPHQAYLNDSLIMVVKPRFRTTKHRGQQAGAFGHQPWITRKEQKAAKELAAAEARVRELKAVVRL